MPRRHPTDYLDCSAPLLEWVLIKQIDVEIDQSSWLTPPLEIRHPLPTQLTNYPTNCDLDFLRALLWVGVLSIPVRIPRWWLAIRWAQVRYLGIVDDSSARLRLHPAADDLDAHQKMVLSDDWGMGVALEWLSRTFSYSLLDHGASYLKRLEQQGLAIFQGPARRRGPRKCPDFVGVDASGRLHLIECKGNQQGRRALLAQLADGRGQKQNVSFPDEGVFVGQRLVVGLAIAPAWARWKTLLRVEDPPPEREQEHYTVTAANVEVLSREVEIGALSRMLVLSGEAGLLARILPDELEDFSREDVADANPTREHFTASDQEWVGRIDRMELPAPIRIGERVVRSFEIRHGVSPVLLESLSRPRRREDLPGLLRGASLVPSETRQDARGNGYAAIRWGNSFIADLSLH